MSKAIEENQFEDKLSKSELEFRKHKKLMETLIEEFIESSYFKKLNEVQKENSIFIVRAYDDYSYDYDYPGIEEWDEYSMRECCLEMLPAKISAKKEVFECIAPVLEQFFTFLYDKRILKKGKNMADEVMKLGDNIVERSQNSQNWGMAKNFFMGSNNAESDILGSFLGGEYVENTPIISELKIGRNDPCTCGSGKKYKKCCGK